MRGGRGRRGRGSITHVKSVFAMSLFVSIHVHSVVSHIRVHVHCSL